MKFILKNEKSVARARTYFVHFYNKKIIDSLRKSQRSLAYKKKISDFVIKNNFKLQSLKKNIKMIKRKILDERNSS